MEARAREELEVAAYHEAGHAVVAYLLRCPIQFATIEEGLVITLHGDEIVTGGNVSILLRESWSVHWLDFTPNDYRDFENEVMIMSAGNFVEWLQYGELEPPDVRTNTDIQKICALFKSTGFDENQENAYLDWLFLRTMALLERPENRRAIGALAGELLGKRKLTGRKVRKVISEAIQSHLCE
jgi:hypothetical protein